MQLSKIVKQPEIQLTQTDIKLLERKREEKAIQKLIERAQKVESKQEIQKDVGAEGEVSLTMNAIGTKTNVASVFNMKLPDKAL